MKIYFIFTIVMLVSKFLNSKLIDFDFDEKTQNFSQTIASFRAIKNLAEKSNDPIQLEKLKSLVENLKKADAIFSIFNMKFNIPKNPETPFNIGYDCYRYVIETYKTTCLDLKEFDLPYMKFFAYGCQYNQKEDMAEFLKQTCKFASANK